MFSSIHIHVVHIWSINLQATTMVQENTVHFRGVFWTSDHMTGIRALFEQLELGHAEGHDSLAYFEGYLSILDLEAQKFAMLSQRQKRLIDRNWPQNVKESKIVGAFVDSNEKIGSVKDLIKEQARYATESMIMNQRLHSRFDSDLVIRLKDFLEDYRDFIDDSRKALQNQYNTYVSAVQTAQATEKKVSAKVRTLEEVGGSSTIYEVSELAETNALPPTPEKVSGTPKADGATSPESNLGKNTTEHGAGTETQIPPSTESEEDEAFQFPLTLGITAIDNVEELRDLLLAMVEQIPVKRRLIPIPGVNNEYFSSEKFSDWVRQMFVKEDSRLKVEKFGQDLIDLGLMRSWNKLAGNTFVSDGGYYEFTDLARFTAEYNTADTTSAAESLPKPVPFTMTKKKSNRRSLTPTSDIWSNLKSTFSSTSNSETLKSDIEDLQGKYVNAVNAANEERTLLDTLHLKVCDKAEIFEGNRLKLLFALNKIFTESVLADHELKAKNLTKTLENFTFNDNTLICERLRRATSGNAGWYWPKPEAKYLEQTNVTRLSILDVDLVNQIVDPNDSDVKTKSVPLFVKLMLAKCEDIEGVGKMWEDDLDIAAANVIKRKIVEYIGQHSQEPDAISVIKRLVSVLFDTEKKDDLVSFFKLYLLELPDSVIPFTSYDALLRLCETGADKQQLINVLGSIPRQNLSTLLLICDHVSRKCKIAEDLVKTYQIPFYHLILRPSPRKLHVSISDGIAFEPLVFDLLEESFQSELHQKLMQLEEFHNKREKRVQESINRLKQEREKVTSSTSSTPSKLETNNNNLTPDGLRAFKVKSPVPTPISSPKGSRSRTNSNATPGLKRPSENLSKRNSLIAHDP